MKVVGAPLSNACAECGSTLVSIAGWSDGDEKGCSPTPLHWHFLIVLRFHWCLGSSISSFWSLLSWLDFRGVVPPPFQQNWKIWHPEVLEVRRSFVSQSQGPCLRRWVQFRFWDCRDTCFRCWRCILRKLVGLYENPCHHLNPLSHQGLPLDTPGYPANLLGP